MTTFKDKLAKIWGEITGSVYVERVRIDLELTEQRLREVDEALTSAADEEYSSLLRERERLHSLWYRYDAWFTQYGYTRTPKSKVNYASA